MKQLFALAVLGLFAAVPVLAAEPAEGGLLRKVVPHDKFAPRPRMLSGIGQLTPAEHKPRPGFSTAHLPRWQVVLGDALSEQALYYLVFDGKKKSLEKLADKLKGAWVKVNGRVERRNFPLSRVPRRPGGPVFSDRPHVSLTVLVVDSLEEVPAEQVGPRQPARVTVKAKLHYVGNSYSRTKEGGIVGTLKGYPWEGCYIVLNGRTVWLVGLPGDLVDYQGYQGQTLVLVGRLERRPGDKVGLTPDALVVESFQSA
jgi:hypothetical protein